MLVFHALPSVQTSGVPVSWGPELRFGTWRSPGLVGLARPRLALLGDRFLRDAHVCKPEVEEERGWYLVIYY